jgi:2-polyprenyl-6-methoxyphenol hydroxylase-like FAD-dependent oxidoreductase
LYDVIVVGARCAGATTAMLLARAGYRVLILERSRMPGDTLSTLHIHRPGLELLDGWGLLEPLIRSGCPPVRRLSYTVGDVTIAGSFDASQTIDAVYAPRRPVLDGLLSDAAVRAGAELRDRCTVHELEHAPTGRVTGVRYREAGGRSRTEGARLVIGADGMRSTVARLAGAAVTRQDAPLTCAYYTFWAGPGVEFEVYERDGCLVGAVPTHDGSTLVAVYQPLAAYPAFRRDPAQAYWDAVRTTAAPLADRLSGTERRERWYGTGQQWNFFRRPAGPGWVLVGDAGHHKDSLTGTGMTDAFRQADALARAIGGRLHDDTALAESLADFAAWRDEHFAAHYRVTLEAARLRVTPERLELLRWIASDPAATATFLDVTVGAALPPGA